MSMHKKVLLLARRGSDKEFEKENCFFLQLNLYIHRLKIQAISITGLPEG